MRIVSCCGLEARFKDMPGNEIIRDDPKAFTLAIHLETVDGLTSVHYMDFTRQVVTKGKFYDKWVQANSRPPTRIDEALDKLEEIGIPNGLPQELQKLMEAGQTIEVNASIKSREFQQGGVTKLAYEAKYLNCCRKEIPLKELNFDDLLPETKGKVSATPQAKPVTIPIKPNPTPAEIAEADKGEEEEFNNTGAEDEFEIEDEEIPF
jgi:hypothetical protein